MKVIRTILSTFQAIVRGQQFYKYAFAHFLIYIGGYWNTSLHLLDRCKQMHHKRLRSCPLPQSWSPLGSAGSARGNQAFACWSAMKISPDLIQGHEMNSGQSLEFKKEILWEIQRSYWFSHLCSYPVRLMLHWRHARLAVESNRIGPKVQLLS